MSSTYFISDLHLDAARPHVLTGLAAFLQRIAHCDALYILGDLFESWVGDDDDSTLATDTAHLLHTFSDAGPPIYLMAGNRDFLIGKAFARAAGATLIPDPRQINLYGTPTLLLHGDSLCTGDTAYQSFRARARDPRWQADMLSHSLPERRALAQRLRQISHEAKSNKAQDITEVDQTSVHAVASEHRVQRMIHGHTHRPGRHDTDFGERWVLGDWDAQGWALEVNAESSKLNNFQLLQ